MVTEVNHPVMFKSNDFKLEHTTQMSGGLAIKVFVHVAVRRMNSHSPFSALIIIVIFFYHFSLTL